MVPFQTLIDNRKKLVTPIRGVLLHPFVCDKLHIFADDRHALRIELRAISVRQIEVEDAPNQLGFCDALCVRELV